MLGAYTWASWVTLGRPWVIGKHKKGYFHVKAAIFHRFSYWECPIFSNRYPFQRFGVALSPDVLHRCLIKWVHRKKDGWMVFFKRVMHRPDDFYTRCERVCLCACVPECTLVRIALHSYSAPEYWDSIKNPGKSRIWGIRGSASSCSCIKPLISEGLCIYSYRFRITG